MATIIQSGEQRTIGELIPGDLIVLGNDGAVYVQQGPHPFWPGFQLVIWRHTDGTWYHDCLKAKQVANGGLRPADDERRKARLFEVFTADEGKPLRLPQGDMP